MEKNWKAWMAGCLGLTVLFSACAADIPAAEAPMPLETTISSVSAAPTAEPTPTPEPSPAPEPEEILALIPETDIFEFISPELYARSEGQRWYEPVVAHPEETLALPDAYADWAETAMSRAQTAGLARLSLKVDPPSWPMLAAIIANYDGDLENMRTALYKAGGFRCEISPAETGEYDATIVMEPPDAPTLMYELPETDSTNPFSLLAAYAYLSTVFDDSMDARDGIGTPELDELLFPLVQPDRYYVGDCWAQPRDGGARLHTGIDINAPEGTNLLAVTDGVILDNGYNKVAGNYVVLRAPSGIQYHYYHLVEPSDLPPGTPVTTGDVVGHVGSTGNSRANHLHFTVITADGHYVNPFTYMQKAQQDTIAAG